MNKITRFLKSLKWSQVIFGMACFCVACVLPVVGDFLVGTNGLVTKLRTFVQTKIFKK